MQAIVPVAGIGTRLRPHTYTIPKALIPVAGKPILAHILDLLVPAGVDRLILVTGYLGGPIAGFVAENYEFELHVAVQDRMGGLADAINRAAPFVEDEPVLVVLGDTLFNADLLSVTGSRTSMIATREVDDPSRFGVVVLEDGRVSRLVEKPEEPISNLAIVGVYYFTSARRLMRATSELIESGRRTRGEFQLTDAMQRMLEDGEPFTVFPVRDWFDCGKPETLLETNRSLLERLECDIPGSLRSPEAGNSFHPPVHIASGVQIEKCTIGPFASIGPGSRIFGSTVRDSILFGDCEVRDSTLELSILGTDTLITGIRGSLDLGASSAVRGVVD